MFKAKLSALLAGAVALGVIALAVPAAHANLITCGTGLNCNLGSAEWNSAWKSDPAVGVISVE